MQMKTFLLPIFAVSFLIISLILFSAFMSKNDSFRLDFPDQGQTESSIENLNFFEKEETEAGFELTYGWKDFSGNTFYISFALSKKELSEAEKEFGFYEDDLDKHLDKNTDELMEEMMNYLKELTLKLITNSKYPQYIQIEEINPTSFNLIHSAPPSLRERMRREFTKISNKVIKERDLLLKKVVKELEKRKKIYLEKRGVRLAGNKIEVDYDFCVRNNRRRVTHVFELIKKINRNSTLYNLLSLMAAFVQEIRYINLQYKENNKAILGFWVPPKVLNNNMGDCDSKAITFASMWTHLKNYPLVLIKIKDHLFVGVALPSPRESGLTINGLKYTLFEVAGPDKFPVGLITRYSQIHLETGQFRYELIRTAQ